MEKVGWMSFGHEKDRYILTFSLVLAGIVLTIVPAYPWQTQACKTCLPPTLLFTVQG
jgi:hypothetical protein